MPNQFGEYQAGDVMIDGQWVNERDDLYAKYGDLAGQMWLDRTQQPAQSDIQQLYQNVASGAVKLSPTDFDRLFSDEDRALSSFEFGLMSPEVQSWARANPQQFMTSILANRNPANQDLGSVGAEGGYSNLGAIQVGSGGLDYSNAGYLNVNDGEWYEDPLNLALLAAGIYTGGAALGAWGGGAASGAAGMGAVDYGLTAGGIPSLSTYGATGLAGTGTPMLSTYGMGGLAGTGVSSLGTLAGTAGLTGSALAGSGNWWDTAKSMYNTASTANKTYNAANSLFGSPSGVTSGGNMADTNWATTLSPFLSAANTWNQSGNTADTYDKAYNLITTPSPDQQKYRDQLALLMSNPGSMETSPVYQAMQEAGMNNVNRTAAANGMLGSGNRLAELMKVGEDTASKYYFPQQQALAGLSGIQNDSAQRTLGADSLISGRGAQNRMQTSMLSDLMGGFGVKTPEQKLIDAYIKRFGGNADDSTSGVNTIVNGVKSGYDWLTGGGSGSYNEASNSMPYIDPWSYDASSGGVDWSQYLNTPSYDPSAAFDMSNWF